MNVQNSGNLCMFIRTVEINHSFSALLHMNVWNHGVKPTLYISHILS